MIITNEVKKMILDIYKDSFEYSAKDWQTLLILGVCCLLSVFLLPIFIITGYYYKVIDIAVHGIINGRDPLPEFDDLVDMFVSGIKVIVVQLVYLLIPAVIFLIFALLASLSGDLAGTGVMILGCLITFICLIITCLMREIAICHMAQNDGLLSKAFAFGEIKEAIDEIGWFNCTATYIGLILISIVLSSVVTSIIYGIFTVFGISGAILGADAGGILLLGMTINFLISMFIVGPYLCIFNARSIGLLYTTQLE